MLTIAELKKASDLLYGRKFSFTVDGNAFLCTMIILDCFDPTFTYNEHAHSFYEFHYILNGKGKVGINGIEYPLDAGDFYLTGKGVPHWQTSDAIHPMEEMCLRIQPHSSTIKDSKIIQILDSRHSPVKDDGSLLDIFYSIFGEALYEKPFSEDMICLNISRFVYCFSRFFNKVSLEKLEYSKDPDMVRMNLINTYIYDHLESKLTCDEIAEQVFLCKRQLTRIMLKYTGTSPHQYIKLLRLEKAFSLIKNTSLPLKEIAPITGFSNEFHLSTAIKKQYAVTPKEIRNHKTKDSLN